MVWFLLDYLTVRNERVIERFVKCSGSRYDWETVSCLIASYFSVFRVEKDRTGLRLAEPEPDGLRFGLEERDWPLDGFPSFVIARPVRVGVKMLLIDPVVPLEERMAKTVIGQREKLRKELDLPLRILMQREGMQVFRELFSQEREEM
jgi:hypothetical protein